MTSQSMVSIFLPPETISHILALALNPEYPKARQILILALSLVSKDFKAHIDMRKEIIISSYEQLIQVDKVLADKKSPWRQAQRLSVDFDLDKPPKAASYKEALYDGHRAMYQRLAIRLPKIRHLVLYGGVDRVEHAAWNGWYAGGFFKSLQSVCVRPRSTPCKVGCLERSAHVMDFWKKGTTPHLQTFSYDPVMRSEYETELVNGHPWVSAMWLPELQSRGDSKPYVLAHRPTLRQLHLRSLKLSRRELFEMANLLPLLTHFTTGEMSDELSCSLTQLLPLWPHLEYLSLKPRYTFFATQLSSLIRHPKLADIALIMQDELPLDHEDFIRICVELVLNEILLLDSPCRLFRLRFDFPHGAVDGDDKSLYDTAHRECVFEDLVAVFKSLDVTLEIGHKMHDSMLCECESCCKKRREAEEEDEQEEEEWQGQRLGERSEEGESEDEL